MPSLPSPQRDPLALAGLYLSLAGERGDLGAGAGTWMPAPPPSLTRRVLAAIAALLLAAAVPLWSSYSDDIRAAVTPAKPGVAHDHQDDDGGAGPGGDGDGDGGAHGVGKARPLATIE